MKQYLVIFAAFILFSCEEKTNNITISTIAESYVKLALDIGQYDDSFVDAYMGPEEWRPTAKKEEKLPLDRFVTKSNELISNCDILLVNENSAIENTRLNMLKKQLIAVRTKVKMISGITFKFDEEAKLLYDATPPHFSEAHFDKLLAKLDTVLPGKGNLTTRYNDYLKDFVIPTEKLDTVFRIAINESRRITKKYFDLPENENFVLEYVNDKVWSGYNFFQGNSQSLIQMNTDFPIYISRAVDLASHEGYPGHHVYMMLIEQNLVKNKKWMEFSVYPLFSPFSLIAEGSANYGIDMVFSSKERIKFEKEFLFPIAGIDVSKADLFYEVQDIIGQLSYADNEAARSYLDGKITRDEAAKWIEKYLLSSPKKAQQRIGFIETNRSYVINYNLGKDMIAKHIEASGGNTKNMEKRWGIFKELLSNPYTASTLKK